MLISKIISGGQTGVDRGALEAALELGFDYGGLIPKGRRAEATEEERLAGRPEGIVPLCFDRMEEAPSANYIYRTEANVIQSDATLIIDSAGRNLREYSVPRSLTGGTLKTWRFTVEHDKPCLVLVTGSVRNFREWVGKLRQNGWLPTDRGIVLNVAGPRESKCPGIQAKTKAFIKRLIEASREDGV